SRAAQGHISGRNITVPLKAQRSALSAPSSHRRAWRDDVAPQRLLTFGMHRHYWAARSQPLRRRRVLVTKESILRSYSVASEEEWAHPSRTRYQEPDGTET